MKSEVGGNGSERHWCCAVAHLTLSYGLLASSRNFSQAEAGTRTSWATRPLVRPCEGLLRQWCPVQNMCIARQCALAEEAVQLVAGRAVSAAPTRTKARRRLAVV